MPHPTLTCLGAGALGTYYGAQLAQAGYRVQFILRSEYDHWRTHGVTVDGMRGTIHLSEPDIYNQDHPPPPADLVIVSMKTVHNEALSRFLPAAVKPDGYVCTLQNGLGGEADLAQYVPTSQVFGGLAFLCSSRIGPGHVRQHTTDRLTLGPYGEGSETGARMLADAMNAAGVKTRVTSNLPAARWEKLAWNMPFNGLCALHDKTVNEVLADEVLHAQVREIYAEVLTAGQVLTGWRPPEDFIDRQIAASMKMEAYAPSMLLDARAGRPLEWETIHARPVEIARAAGISMPRSLELADALRARFGGD